MIIAVKRADNQYLPSTQLKELHNTTTFIAARKQYALYSKMIIKRYILYILIRRIIVG